MQHYKTYLPDEAATQALGKSLTHCLQSGLIIYLIGNLGAGKTALTRAILHAAGHQGNVKSPTYTLVEPYQIVVQGQSLTCMHFDLYRMISPDEFIEAGFRDEFNDHNICIVEWPEKAATLLPPADIHITLTVLERGREVHLQAISEKGVTSLGRLHFASAL